MFVQAGPGLRAGEEETAARCLSKWWWWGGCQDPQPGVGKEVPEEKSAGVSRPGASPASPGGAGLHTVGTCWIRKPGPHTPPLLHPASSVLWENLLAPHPGTKSLAAAPRPPCHPGPATSFQPGLGSSRLTGLSPAPPPLFSPPPPPHPVYSPPASAPEGSLLICKSDLVSSCSTLSQAPTSPRAKAICQGLNCVPRFTSSSPNPQHLGM